MTESPATFVAQRSTSDMFVTEAVRIGEELCGASKRLADGSLSWGRGETLDRSPCLDAGLFNGRVGEALFLSALFQTTRREEFHHVALDAVAGIMAGADDTAYAVDLLDQIGVGLRGVGGLLYGLTRCAGFLGAPALCDVAMGIASNIASQLEVEGRAHGIMYGTAGFILGSLPIAKAQPRLRATLHGLSTWLLDERVADARTGLRGWQMSAESGVSGGFAHGSTGIAHCLLMASEETGDPRLAEASFEVFDFERSLYRADTSRWPESHVDPGDGIISWCHRAPGFGFARLSPRALQQPGIQVDLEAAIRISRAIPLTQLDGLCCGNFGRAELLLEAGMRLGDDILLTQSQRLAALIVARARTRGYGLPPVRDHMAPGFWQGMAGIGYSLLRLGLPGALPCVLILE